MEPSPRVPVPSLDGGAGTVDRWFAAQGAPLRVDLARSGAPSISVHDLLTVTGTHSDAVMNTPLDYGPGRGDPRLAAAIRASLGAPASAGVVVAAGAVEALLLVCLAAPGRGEVLVGTPAYGSLVSAPAAAGRSVSFAPVWESIGGLSLDRLASLVSVRTGLVVVNTPHNPSGARASLAQLDELAAVCELHGSLLVVDEVARGTLDPGAPSAVHALGFARGTIAVLGDVSKSLGLGGLRIGWLVTADAALADAAAAAKDATTVASATLSEHLAALALENAAALLRPTTAAAQANRASLDAFVRAGRADQRWSPPADGLVAFPPVAAPHGVDRLVADLRAREVGVVPGWLFGEHDRLRLGLAGDPRLFAEALDCLGGALRA